MARADLSARRRFGRVGCIFGAFGLRRFGFQCSRTPRAQVSVRRTDGRHTAKLTAGSLPILHYRHETEA